MKRFLAAAAGLLGIAWLRRRRAPQPSAADPANELRAKLAEARAAGDDREEFEAGEKPVDEADVPPAPDVEERRRAVHEHARAQIDELKGE